MLQPDCSESHVLQGCFRTLFQVSSPCRTVSYPRYICFLRIERARTYVDFRLIHTRCLDWLKTRGWRVTPHKWQRKVFRCMCKQNHCALARLHCGGAALWWNTWSPREGDIFGFAYTRTVFQGLIGWNPAGTALKTSGNMGWVHIPLCKEILEIFGCHKKQAVSQAF